MNEQPVFGNSPEEEKPIIIPKHADNKKLQEIIEGYESDRENFFRDYAMELWDQEKNPALLLMMKMMSDFIKEVWEEKGYGDPKDILEDSRDAAMFVMKYLGAELDGWCRITPETMAEMTRKMGEEEQFKENCRFILDSLKKDDPVFSEFLTKICVNDPRTGEARKEPDMVAMTEMVAYIARAMYEQLKHDGKLN